jgi:hypothetical protein
MVSCRWVLIAVSVVLTAGAAGECLYRLTVDDPSAWDAPWSGEYSWRRSDDRVYEYACHEGNYAMGGILRGARRLEQDAEGGASGVPGTL